MQRLRPSANGATPGPLPDGITAKKVGKADGWFIVENLIPRKMTDNLVTAEGGWVWDCSGIYRWKNGKKVWQVVTFQLAAIFANQKIRQRQ
jgi:hypothetical protein